MPRFVLIPLLLGTLALPLAAAEPQQEARSPCNILFLIADDLGWADVGYHGSEIDTPHLDKLARASVILEQHYVTPMCSSTRACLLSGRFSTRFGLDSATNNRVYPEGMETLASALQRAGYFTGLTGKWHLGSKPEWGPLHYGFTHAYGALAGGIDQYAHLYKKGPYQRTWHRDHEFIKEEGHATDLFAAEAIKWIRDETRESPFYIQVAFTAVHIPIQEPGEYIAPYTDRIANESRRRYAACATHMDACIGRMVRALEETGQRDNTLIIFTSDNGGSGPWKPTGLYPGTYDPCHVLGDNTPLRGQKGTVYEGGIRVPAFIHWPARLKPRKLTHPVHIVDWMPTLLGLAGVEPESDPRWDGIDIWPLLTGELKFPESRTLYFKRGHSKALRRGYWKLVHHNGAEPELYDLRADPNEEHNLAREKPERVDKYLPLLTEQIALDQPGESLKLN